MNTFRRYIKKGVVTAQVVLPSFADAKTNLLSTYRRQLRRPREPAFECLKRLPLSDLAVLVDVGGAKGESVAGMRLFSQIAPIVTFEPNPMYAASIKRRFRADPGVSVQPFGLGDEEGEFTLFVPVYKYTAFPDLGTFDLQEAESWLRSRIFWYKDENLTIAQFPANAGDSIHLRCSRKCLKSIRVRTLLRSYKVPAELSPSSAPSFCSRAPRSRRPVLPPWPTSATDSSSAARRE